MPSRERAYFENHRSQENMLSPELQPHGFSHVVVGENSRTLPQLLTEGLKRVPPCALPGPRVPASSSKFPHARCSILSSSLPIVTTDPFGCRVTLREFHEDRNCRYFEQSFKGSSIDTTCSIGGSRTCPAKGRLISSLTSMPRLRPRASKIIAARTVLRKRSGPSPS